MTSMNRILNRFRSSIRNSKPDQSKIKLYLMDIFLLSIMILSFGTILPTLAKLDQQEEKIKSNSDRVIEIPLDQLHISSDTNLEYMALALWDGNSWNPISFQLRSENDNSNAETVLSSKEGNNSVNKKVYRDTTQLPKSSIDSRLTFKIPMLTSSTVDEEIWWDWASAFNLNYRSKISLGGEINNKMELYLYHSPNAYEFGTNGKSNQRLVLMGSSSDNRSKTLQNNLQEIFEFTKSNGKEINPHAVSQVNSHTSGKSKVRAVQSESYRIYDSGESHSLEKIKNSGWGRFGQVITLPESSEIIGSPSLNIVVDNEGDVWARYLQVFINNHQIASVIVSSSCNPCSYEWSFDSSWVTTDGRNNLVEVVITTWVGYWVVTSASVKSQYDADTYRAKTFLQTTHGDFATYLNPVVRKNIGNAYEWFTIDIPRGQYSTTLRVQVVEMSDDYPRWFRIKLRGVSFYETVIYEEVIYGTVYREIPIDGWTQAGPLNSIEVGIQLYSYTSSSYPSAKWHIYGDIETTARTDPYASSNDEWRESSTVLFDGGWQASLIKDDWNYPAGSYAYKVWNERSKKSQVHIAFGYYIDSVVKQTLIDLYADGWTTDCEYFWTMCYNWKLHTDGYVEVGSTSSFNTDAFKPYGDFYETGGSISNHLEIELANLLKEKVISFALGKIGISENPLTEFAVDSIKILSTDLNQNPGGIIKNDALGYGYYGRLDIDRETDRKTWDAFFSCLPDECQDESETGTYYVSFYITLSMSFTFAAPGIITRVYRPIATFSFIEVQLWDTLDVDWNS